MRLQTILCPIDFSDLSATETEVAVEVAREFGARLVLHHDCAAIAPAIARQWDWEATHGKNDSETQAERRMQAALNALPRELRAEGVVSAGSVTRALLALAAELPADLIVLGSHGWSTETHASVTERIIAEAPCPVLTFNEGALATGRFRLRPAAGGEPPIAVVPTDFSPTAAHAVRYAWELARALPIRVHLLHALPRRSRDAEGAVRSRLAALQPADVSGRVDVHLTVGDAAQVICAHLAAVQPAFAVLGEHARALVRRVFTRDTARRVVHGASCPVWVVPQRVPLRERVNGGLQ
jgi:universal stress protein A